MSERGRSSSPPPGPVTPTSRPRSNNSATSYSSHPRDTIDQASENTPLIPHSNGDVEASDRSNHRSSSAASLLRSFQSKPKTGRRWPSLIALSVLCTVVILIIILAFLAPSVVQEYAMQAATFEPTSLSIHSFTADGVKARVQGDFTMDASRVKKKPVRDLGRFGTWIARKVETGQSHVEVSLPAYGNVVLGTAAVPTLNLDIRNTHTTHVDFLTDLHTGDVDGIRRIANDWIDGKLGELRVLGKASVPIKSGLFNFGRQIISQSLLFADKDIPTMPDYTIHSLNFEEVHFPDSTKAIRANVSISAENPYPVDFVVPPMSFDILVDNCAGSDPYIQLAEATLAQLHIKPKRPLDVDASAFVSHLPQAFTKACPNTHESPMDLLLTSYIHGKDTTVYVRGSESPSPNTPRWITDLISGITVPIPFPGHSFGHLIKNFTLADVNFGLPDPFAEPNTPKAQPHISANVKVIAALPEEMNFSIDVNSISADADVYYHGAKMGRLDLRKWQPANSTRIDSKNNEGPTLAVESSIKNAPLNITDEDVFTDVLEALLFGGKGVVLTIKADVNVQLVTALGELIVRKIPAEGSVPVKPINRGGSFGAFAPKIGNLQILDTGKTSLTFSALANFTNPTEYSAVIPYADIHIMSNGSLLGHATVKSVIVAPGVNINIPVTAVWDPLTLGGKSSRAVGVELLSQYISGYNTTLTLRAHEGSIPSQPALGRALQKFQIEMPTPSLRGPPQDGDDDDDDDSGNGPRFIKDATMHLLTSTASFTLLSPLKSSTLYVTYLDATAFYHGDEVGHIYCDLPFAVPPGATTSPRLPVTWNIGSVGYDAVRGALGGTLKLAARADVGIMLGKWEERIWYQGRSIGARIRL